MFDTYVTRAPSSVHHSTTVHEHRAPTDDSVKLLNEMQQKALNNITASLATSNNTLQLTAHLYQDPALMQHHWGVKLKLNGKEYLIKDKIGLDVGREQAIESLYKSVIAQVSAIIAAPLLKEMHETTRWAR
jgi:hypothetical protein